MKDFIEINVFKLYIFLCYVIFRNSYILIFQITLSHEKVIMISKHLIISVLILDWW